jgi:dUTP pyrophosphatase
MKINIKKLNENAIIPVYSTEFSAGADLYALLDEPVTIKKGETQLIKTGVAMEIPVNYVGLIYARSGLAAKKGLAPANKVGVIDSDYRGEIMVAIYNQSPCDQVIESGERIAQIVITPFIQAEFNLTDSLNETVRGTGGFGSTGIK